MTLRRTSVELSNVTRDRLVVGLPLEQTSSSQKLKAPVIGNCTMTYLAGGRSVSLHLRLTEGPDTFPQHGMSPATDIHKNGHE